jgi:hypothetical protein
MEGNEAAPFKRLASQPAIRETRSANAQSRWRPSIWLPIVTLALGIAENTAVFRIVYLTLLAPLPYPHPEQLVMVWSKIQGDRKVASAGNFLVGGATQPFFKTGAPGPE